MSNNIAGKVVVITGASSGLGANRVDRLKSLSVDQRSGQSTCGSYRRDRLRSGETIGRRSCADINGCSFAFELCERGDEEWNEEEELEQATSRHDRHPDV